LVRGARLAAFSPVVGLPARIPLLVGFAPQSKGSYAQLKNCYILRKLRCCPWNTGQLAKAIHVLQIRENTGCKTLTDQITTIEPKPFSHRHRN
jgi:hypothetical protein